MKPLVSVVVPTFDGIAFVRETLDSVLAQTYAPLELVVCDDGSTDGTLDVVASYGDRLRLVRQANRGVAAARNRAVREAKGELVAFLDHDDVWEKDALATLVPELVARRDLGLVYADSWVIDRTGMRWGRRGEWLSYAHGEVFEALLSGNFIPVETTLMRTELFRRLGGYDERLFFLEDYELCLRVARDARVGYVDAPLASYRVHERNLSHDLERMLIEWWELLRRLEPAGLLRTDAERAIVASEESRLAADVAWRALRRKDRSAAAEWLARSKGPSHASRRAKVRALQALLAMLPDAMGDALLARLPRRKLYGIVARSHGALSLSAPAPSSARDVPLAEQRRA